MRSIRTIRGPWCSPSIKAFTERYKEPPAPYAALGYDTVYLVADAVRRAGSMDREAIRNALATTKGLETVEGSFTFNGSGDNLAQTPHIFENEGGKFKRVD